MIQLKKNKNQKGFTLVEVIVVAIIVAALAAVAIPMYTSYVANSRENSASNAAGSVASYMGACINQAGIVSVTAGTIPTAGASASLLCTVGSVPGATMQLPAGIVITISSLVATGTVTARHIASPTSTTAASYNY